MDPVTLRLLLALAAVVLIATPLRIWAHTKREEARRDGDPEARARRRDQLRRVIPNWVFVLTGLAFVAMVVLVGLDRIGALG